MQIYCAIASIYQHAHAKDLSPCLFNQVHHFPDGAAGCDHIFHNQDLFLRCYFETSADYHTSFFSFCENGSASQLGPHFRAQNNTANGRRNYNIRFFFFELICDHDRKSCEILGVLQHLGTLKICRTVAT